MLFSLVDSMRFVDMQQYLNSKMAAVQFAWHNVLYSMYTGTLCLKKKLGTQYYAL